MKRALAVVSLAAVALAPYASPARAACCYFAAKDKDINQPGQKAFISWEPEKKLEAFTVQPRFEGNAVDFGMVIPTPSQPKLDEMPRDFFKDLAIATILMPLPQAIYTNLSGESDRDDYSAMKGDGSAYAKGFDPEKPSHVVVLEAGVVGSLDYKIISADDSQAMFDWLKQNDYVYSGDTATLKFYIDKKWFFTVMKIDPKQMKKNKDGSYLGEVTPTRFTFTSERCIYPLKITQLSVKDKTDALFYVQAPTQMDLEGDLSWRHSFRVMWLTYMLGCSANGQQQQELAQRNEWVRKKMAADPRFETTKLEWARHLGDGDLAVLEDPLKNYAQMGGGDLPSGAKIVSLEKFLKEIWSDYEKARGNNTAGDEYAKTQLKALDQTYASSKGTIVELANLGGSYSSTRFMWYPNREAPEEDVKGLTRLKGILQGGRWVTKFRKVLRKDEMTDDLLLLPVADGAEQEYVRIMPTSPP